MRVAREAPDAAPAEPIVFEPAVSAAVPELKKNATKKNSEKTRASVLVVGKMTGKVTGT